METIIPIVRSEDIEIIEKTVELLLEVGFSTFEITTNYPDVFEYVNKLNQNNNISVGVGSVTTLKHVEQAKSNNVEFVVTPSFDLEIITELVDNKIPVYAGCLTPSEVSQALKVGVDFIKIFPASTMPKDYANSLKAPFPKGKFIAVGGVNINNYNEYLENGYDGFGFSSDMMTLARQKKWDELRELLINYKGIRL